MKIFGFHQKLTEKRQYVFVSELRPFKCQWPFLFSKVFTWDVGKEERKLRKCKWQVNKYKQSDKIYWNLSEKQCEGEGVVITKRHILLAFFWKTSPRSSHVLNKRLIMRESNKAPLSLVHNCLTMILLWLIIIILYSGAQVGLGGGGGEGHAPL